MSVAVDAAGPNGIPRAIFIEDVYKHLAAKPSFSSDPKLAVEDALVQLQEALSKYKFVSAHHTKKHSNIQAKIPEIQKSIDAVLLIKDTASQDEKTLDIDFELADTLFTRAIVTPSKTVFLWLGASILMSYDVDEALTLLTEKLASSKKTIFELEQDIGFLREQITTVEVNISRIYNWHVKNEQILNSSKKINQPN